MPIRHERRRRLLPDDLAGVTAESRQPVRLAGGDAEGDQPAQSYTDAAKRARGRAVSTFLPSSRFAIALAALASLTMVGACLALHAVSPALASYVPAADVAALRLDEAGSIGHWVASVLLLAAGAVALFVYSLRRHRIDDYHGRYRVWIWISAACLVASLVETTNLGGLARGLCRLAADWSTVSNDVLWPTLVGIIAGGIGLRLFFEIRRCRAAIGALAATVLAFVIAAAAYQSWPIVWSDANLPYWARGSWLVGYALVLTTLLLYARHVQLDVAGSLVVRTRRKRKAPPAPPSEDAQNDPPRKPALRLRTDLDPVATTVTSTAARSQSFSAGPRSASNDSAADDEQQPKSHLSRAERRRMRREARMAS
jgi:hypothetical protein